MTDRRLGRLGGTSFALLVAGIAFFHVHRATTGRRAATPTTRQEAT